MTVYQHKNSPNWQYDFTVKGVRYHGSTGCTSKSAAKEYERKKRNEVAEGRQEKPDITFHEAGKRYWTMTGQHESNHVTTKGQLRRLTEHFGATTILRDIDRDGIDKFVARRRGQKANNKDALVSNATVNREVQLLKRVIARVPATFAKPEIDWKGVMLKEAQERIRELTADEEKRLFARLPEDLAAVAEFALLSGQRRESVITLIWSKVDLSAGRAEVRVKGDKWHSFPLTPRLVALIANRPKVGPRVFTYVCERPAPKRADRPARIKGERYPFSSEGWSRKWKKALSDADITDFRWHDFRHTTGTRLLRATGNLKAAQKLLGHTDIATTARYAHAMEDDVRNAMLEMETRNSPEAVSTDAAKRLRSNEK